MWLRLTSHRIFIKFSLTGASRLFVNLGSFTCCCSSACTATWPRRLPSSTRIRAVKFNAVSLLALGVSYGTFPLPSRAAPEWLQGLVILPAALVTFGST